MAGGGGAEGDCPAPGSGTGTDGLVGVAGGAGALGRSRLALARLHHAMRMCVADCVALYTHAPLPTSFALFKLRDSGYRTHRRSRAFSKYRSAQSALSRNF